MESDPSQFDAEFFGIKPSEAKSMDPQQRLLMEVVFESIEAAGMTIAGLKGSDTAVYAGLMTNDYGMMLTRDLAHVPTYHATGISSAIVSNRISYFFDWHGPSMTVDTGCSASLVALHLAVQSLRNGESRVALACGTNLILGPEYFVIESKLKMLSPDGRSKMWDQEANGYARGDGVAAVVLKTLSAAIADGDHIECVIRETGLNQDGATPGLTMPSAAAQEALIRSTYAKAGLDLRDPKDRPQYFEAHGTGTPAGDPIEAEAISRAFFQDELGMNGESSTALHQPLYVGSIKTVLGHTEGSAGIAAILKASLALQHATVPPNLLFNKLSSSVAPFYQDLEIVTEARPWPTLPQGQVRRASVNSFGFGGANAHAILESYVPPSAQLRHNAVPPCGRPLYTPFVFSAPSERALRATLESFATYLETHPDVDLSDLAWTLRERRAQLPYRAAFSASAVSDLSAKINAQLPQDGARIGVKALPLPRDGSTHAILGVFTGQGAQYARMGAELIEQSPMASSIIESLENVLNELPEADRPTWSLRAELLAVGKASRLHEATISQPLCTAVQVMVVDLLQAAGIHFNAVVGHSSGEIAAAYAAGFLTAREAIYVAYYRGMHLKLAQSPNGKNIKGAMLAVGSSTATMSQLCASECFNGRIFVAASNSSSSVTISGDEDAIGELGKRLADEKVFHRRLRVDKAYHSTHMRPCGDPYIASLNRCVRERQTQDQARPCSWYSSVHEGLVDGATGVSPKYWSENMTSPVLFEQALTRACKMVDFDMAIEIGAHPALQGPATQTIGEVYSAEKVLPYLGTLNRGSVATQTFSSFLGQMWCVLGSGEIRLSGCGESMSLSAGGKRSVVKGLPSKVWDHSTRHWHESRASRQLRLRPNPVHQLLGDVTSDSTFHNLSWRNLLRVKELEWLSGHAIQGQTVFPAAGYMCSAIEAARSLAGDADIRLIELSELTIHHALVLPDDDSGIEVLIELSRKEDSRTEHLEAKFSYSAAIGNDVETLTLTASANLTVKVGNPSTTLLPGNDTNTNLPNATNVDTEHFYSALAEIGYNFGGPFRSMTQLTRKHQRSASLIKTQLIDSEADTLLIHPAELDAAFQAILLARTYPGDEQLRTLHLPSKIGLMRINPASCKARGPTMTAPLPIEATILPVTQGQAGLVGDVNIYSSIPSNTMIQIQGAKLVPFGGSIGTDRSFFSATHWIRSSIDDSSFICITQEQQDVMTLMERLSVFYLRRLEAGLPADHPARTTRPTSLYIDHARRTTALVNDGNHRLANKEWLSDTLDSVIDASVNFVDVPDIRLMHLVGEHMPRALRGETTMFEEFREADLLGEYYQNGVVIQASASWIIGVMKQLVDHFPHMHILELGAGSGEGVRSRIPAAMEGCFSTYTYANVSGSVQPDGTAFFSQSNDPKPTRTFDFELEPSSQSFVHGSHDVVIAFWTMHATRNIESALRNVRKLLRPGGHLIVAEGSYTKSGSDGGLTAIFGTLAGWWLGADQGRTSAPYLSVQQWNHVLRSAGFSGVDKSSPDEVSDTFGTRLFETQAVDEQVNFLRDPLASLTSGSMPLQRLVFVGGLTPRSSRLMDGLKDIFSKSRASVASFQALEDVDHSTIDHQTAVISLAELDEPVLIDMNAARFAALKKMFGYGKKLFWVTSGRLDRQPHSNLTLGFSRTAQVESPDLIVQQVDIADAQSIEAHDLAREFLRFATTVPDQVLWNRETEIAIDASGQVLFPRLKPVQKLNDQYNASSRRIERLVHTSECEVILQMSADSTTARIEAPRHLRQCEDLLELKVLLSTSRAIKTLVGHQFVALCRDESTCKTYLALLPCLASATQLAATSIVPFSGDTVRFNLVVANLISAALLKHVNTGSTVVVHNASEPIATVLSAQASSSGLNLVFTAEAASATAVGIQIMPYSTRHDLMTVLPGDVSLFVGLSQSDDQRELNEAAMISCMPHHCDIESADTLFAFEGSPSASSSKVSALRSALHGMDCCDPKVPRRVFSHPTVIDVRSVVGASPSQTPLQILDWTTSTVLPVLVEDVRSRFKLDDDKTYWIIGLSAALCASLFDFMIQQGAKHLVFSSRHPAMDLTWLDRHRRNGIQIEIVACDVADEESLRTAHAKICDGMPAIAGVMNGAAVFRDNSLLKMSLEEFNDALRPKVFGSSHLDRLFYNHHLDFFILTSSITGLLGSAGQANYAAANTFMCGLAAQRRRRGLAATAINLGAIAGIGLLEREDRKVLESIMQRLSLMPVSEADFHDIFAAAVEAGRPEFVSCDAELTTALRTVANDDASAPGFYLTPMFSHFRVKSDQKQEKGSKAKSTHEKLAACETREDVTSIVRGAFSHEMRKALQTNIVDDELMELRSTDLGIDSLVSIDLRTWFTKTLKVNMPVLKIMSNDPLTHLVAFAVEHIPPELLPMLSDGQASEAADNGDLEATLDWDAETAPPADFAELPSKSFAMPPPKKKSMTVVLTGATGLLGHHILTTLLEQPEVIKVHCLAVRRLEERLRKGDLLIDDRVVYHAGELHEARLGLSEETAARIFENADAVIHNGADTSHLKSYFDLKPSNVESTVELLRLCLPRRIPMHFVSSNAVGRYSNKERIGEVAIYSPGAPHPPTDGSSGYRSTKWAAETLLERVRKVVDLPIWIHRPSTIIRTGKDAEGQAAQLDWMNALIWYMDKLTAVPKLNHGTGFLDLVHSRTVCTGIVSHVMQDNPALDADSKQQITYVHHMADLLLPLAKLEDLSKGSGRVFRQLSREEWISEAVAAGMHPAVVVLLEMMDAPDLKGPPMFVKGPGSPSEPVSS